MTRSHNPDPPARLGGTFGAIAVLLGSLALLVAVANFFGGPFGAQPSIGTSIGEIASEAGKSALRDVLGQPQPVGEVREWTIDRALWLGAAIGGALAIVASVVAFVRHEPRRAIVAGAALGAGAIVFQFAAAIVLAVLTLLLIGMILGSLGLGLDASSEASEAATPLGG